MTADEYWRADCIAREFGPAAPSALPVSEVEDRAPASSPGEVVVTVLHVGDSLVVPPSEESPAITLSGVVADVAQPSEEPVVPPSSPAPVEVPADPDPPRKDRKRRPPSSYSSDSVSYSTEDDTEDEESPSRCLLYTSPSPRDGLLSRMPSSA